jgi:hypothetical protein
VLLFSLQGCGGDRALSTTYDLTIDNPRKLKVKRGSIYGRFSSNSGQRRASNIPHLNEEFHRNATQPAQNLANRVAGRQRGRS